LSLCWSLAQVLVLVPVLGGQVLVLVGQVLVNILLNFDFSVYESESIL